MNKLILEIDESSYTTDSILVRPQDAFKFVSIC